MFVKFGEYVCFTPSNIVCPHGVSSHFVCLSSSVRSHGPETYRTLRGAGSMENNTSKAYSVFPIPQAGCVCVCFPVNICICEKLAMYILSH